MQLGKRRHVLEESFATRLDEVERRREAAEMERRRQELLIDVTSHELRNPTSAIIQCSQMVGSNLTELRQQLIKLKSQSEFGQFVDQDLLSQLEADEELCNNIYACAQHQSRIADDILALARISMDMLQFFKTPVDIKAKALEVVNMFALEAKSKDIELDLDTSHPSLKQMPIVDTDPTRLGQVCINLVMNALKWTAGADNRKVSISMALCPEMPPGETCEMPNVPLPSDIQDGDPLYLYVAVRDSGPGLSKDDLNLMFKRFSQATQASSKVFGGSGLGLFVSKQIVLQSEWVCCIQGGGGVCIY